MIERDLHPVLLDLAGKYPALTVTGPRQSGRTTLCRSAFPGLEYVSLEAPDLCQFAREDPRAFLDRYRGGVILDEVQNVPDLLSYLQVEIDEKPDPGRFVLTGSQHFGRNQAISQSLAGRTALLQLLPPSLAELRRFPGIPDDLFELMVAGSYPRIWDRKIEAGRWLSDYVATYVERDVRQVLQVGDLETFLAFLRLVAGRP